MREHELFSIYCGDTLVEVWGEALSMDDITDYKVGNVSVLEMIYSLDKDGKFEQSVYEKMYEIRNS